MLVRDRVYEVLHPGEPVEHGVRKPETYVFVADSAYQAVRTPDPRAHLRLLDLEGNVLAESVEDELGARLSFAAATENKIYGIAVEPRGVAAQQPTLALQWEQKPATRTSENLVRNSGAEAPGGELSEWRPRGDEPPAQRLAYGERDNLPSPVDAGPQDRGGYFFAGAPGAPASGLRQEIEIDPEWRAAIHRNSVRADFSSYLGGHLREGDFAAASLRFMGEDQQELGRIALSGIGPLERSGRSGLWPAAERQPVPQDTVALIVELVFTRMVGRQNDSYADNVSVILSEY